MNLPQGIDSKFRLILMAARRARQIQGGARLLMQSSSKKPTRIAQQEVEAGLIPFEILEVKNDGEGAERKSKKKAAK